MPVCDLCSLAIDADAIVFDGPDGAGWRLPLASLAAIGEFVAADLEQGHQIAFVIRGDESWFQAPRGAVGAAAVLATLSARLGTALHLRVDPATAPASRVMWPPALVDAPLLVFGGEPGSAGAAAAGRAHLHPAVLSRRS